MTERLEFVHARGGSIRRAWTAAPATRARPRALIAWAFAHTEVTCVIAEACPELWPSIRVMEKNGLRFVGDGLEARVSS